MRPTTLQPVGFVVGLGIVAQPRVKHGLKFAQRLTNYLKHWLEASRVSDFKALFDLLFREQFLASCGRDHSIFLKERDPKSIHEMVQYADQYIVAHGEWQQNPTKGKFGK